MIDFSLRTAILEDKLKVTDEIIEKAFETLQYGDAKPQTLEQLERTARHKAGHALLCYLSGETPSYLTIVSRGNNGGYMQHANEEGKTFFTKNELLAKIRTSLGGKAAEIVYYGEEGGLTTTASSDFAAATKLAERMVCSYSMDKAFGMRIIEPSAGTPSAIAQGIHERVNQILDEQMNLAVQTIYANMAAIESLVQTLLSKNHMTGSDIIKNNRKSDDTTISGGTNMTLRKETIEKLTEIYRDDDKILKIIERSLTSFEEYHGVIFKMELWMKIYARSVSGDAYKEHVSKLDKTRTMVHNSVLGNVNLLNRLAEKTQLPPVYDGVVSHERPYRREVANAVLEYVEDIIKSRR